MSSPQVRQEPRYAVEFIRGDERWRVETPADATLFEVARHARAPVETLCHGIGACVRCKVRVKAGELTSPTPLERDRLGNVFHITRERLACQARVQSAVTLEIPEPRRKRRRRASSS